MQSLPQFYGCSVRPVPQNGPADNVLAKGNQGLQSPPRVLPAGRWRYVFVLCSCLPSVSSSFPLTLNLVVPNFPCVAGDYLLTLAGLKRLIYDREGIHPDQQEVFFCGRWLGHDRATLVQMQLSDGDIIEVRRI